MRLTTGVEDRVAAGHALPNNRLQQVSRLTFAARSRPAFVDPHVRHDEAGDRRSR